MRRKDFYNNIFSEICANLRNLRMPSLSSMASGVGRELVSDQMHRIYWMRHYPGGLT